MKKDEGNYQVVANNRKASFNYFLLELIEAGIVLLGSEVKSLRLGKALESGFVVTVEPGIYMIPELIDIWQAENKNADFINYDKVNEYRNFGGIRVEDEFLITDDSYRLLGDGLIKTVEEIENYRAEHLA